MKVIHGDTDADADGLGHLRQPHHRGRRRRARAVAIGKIKDKALALSGAPARGGGRGHRLRRRQVLREGRAGQGQDDPGRGPDGQRRLEHARRAWSRASRRRASSTRPTSSSRSARTSPWSRSTRRPAPSTSSATSAVDDCGPLINPMIVEGQVHGGVVQGIGQALWEEAVYDDNGQLLTGLDDGLRDAAGRRPARHRGAVHRSRRRRINPLGVKGIGEAGTIASTCAVYNAVIDALRAARRARSCHAADPRTRLAGRCRRRRREPDMYSPVLRLSPRRRRWPTRRSCSPPIPARSILAGGHSLLPLMKLRLAAPTRARRHRPGRRTEGHQRRRRRRADRRAHHPRGDRRLRRRARQLRRAGRGGGVRSAIPRSAIAAPSAAASPTPIRPRICPPCWSRSAPSVDVAGAKGARTVAAKDFFVGMMATALADGEVLTVDLGARASGRGAAPPTPSSRTRPRATPSSASLRS